MWENRGGFYYLEVGRDFVTGLNCAEASGDSAAVSTRISSPRRELGKGGCSWWLGEGPQLLDAPVGAPLTALVVGNLANYSMSYKKEQ